MRTETAQSVKIGSSADPSPLIPDSERGSSESVSVEFSLESSSDSGPRLVAELFPRILDFADRATLSRCLRVNREWLGLAGRRLYRRVAWDPTEHDGRAGPLAGLKRSDEFGSSSSASESVAYSSKGRLLGHTRHLEIWPHDHSVLPPPLHSVSLPFPSVSTLRLCFAPMERSNFFCQVEHPVSPVIGCPLLGDCQPTTLVVENIYSLSSPRPTGFGVPGDPLPPCLASVKQLMIRPSAYRDRRRPGRPRTVRTRSIGTGRVVLRVQLPDNTRPTPMLSEMRGTLEEVYVVFETLPDEGWPRIEAVTEGHAPSPPASFASFVGEMVEAVTASSQWVFVNAGHIDSDLLNLGALGVKDTQLALEAEFTTQLMERLKKAGVEEETKTDWLERVEWWSMEKFMERGFGWALQEQTEEVWSREMEKRKRGEGEEMREKELALIEGFAVSTVSLERDDCAKGPVEHLVVRRSGLRLRTDRLLSYQWDELKRLHSMLSAAYERPLT
ncbi:hypothetical protein EHS25_008552 [Saitozyma podzolica]|uniref:F-box domain-containing protein n=1 Tax=Saitozyma podzolica TaxID=1890683 RepID=A0A427YM50_9TREE|nr:hypothetical protein EHS25_008552 [Saitozyma podzolica]